MTKNFFIAEKIDVGKNKRKYSLAGGVEHKLINFCNFLIKQDYPVKSTINPYFLLSK
jgi:hypothetical protein